MNSGALRAVGDAGPYTVQRTKHSARTEDAGGVPKGHKRPPAHKVRCKLGIAGAYPKGTSAPGQWVRAKAAI